MQLVLNWCSLSKLSVKSIPKRSLTIERSFSKYLWAYTNDKIIYEKKENETTSTLSDQISKDLKKKGMSFVGSITIYSYLEAIGIYNHHDRNCFLHL